MGVLKTCHFISEFQCLNLLVPRRGLAAIFTFLNMMAFFLVNSQCYARNAPNIAEH